MAAEALGYKRGREYLSLAQIETITFSQYYDQGRVEAEKQYRRAKAQEEYLIGWHTAGEQFIVLFKLDDANLFAAQKRLASLRARLGKACTDLEILLEWRKGNPTIQGYLQSSYQWLDQIQNNLDSITEYLVILQER